MIHGWPLSADTWDDQAVALADAGYRAIAYDRRGFGRSSQPWCGYYYDTLADDLAAVFQYTGTQDAVIVGFSMGGGEVARYMSRHDGQSVSKAVLISSVLPYRLKTSDNPNGTEQAAFDQTAQALRADRPAFLEEFLSDFFGASRIAHPVSDELLAWARGIALQATLKATLACAKSFSSTDDQVVPIGASSRLTAQSLPQATLIEYEGAPHGLFATHKARLTQDLLDFLAR